MSLHFEPEMMKRMGRRKEETIEGRNDKLLNPLEERQRKLEERLMEAEEEIEKMKEAIGLEEKEVPSKLNLSKLYIMKVPSI